MTEPALNLSGPQDYTLLAPKLSHLPRPWHELGRHVFSQFLFLPMELGWEPSLLPETGAPILLDGQLHGMQRASRAYGLDKQFKSNAAEGKYRIQDNACTGLWAGMQLVSKASLIAHSP